MKQQELTNEQKKKFEGAKAKQMDPKQEPFDAESDEDTTSKSEAFSKKRAGPDNSERKNDSSSE